MAQMVPQLCPRCGAELLPEQRFCARCGLDRATLPPMAPQPSPFTTSPISQPGLPPSSNAPVSFSAPGGPISQAGPSFDAPMPFSAPGGPISQPGLEAPVNVPPSFPPQIPQTPPVLQGNMMPPQYQPPQAPGQIYQSTQQPIAPDTPAVAVTSPRKRRRVSVLLPLALLLIVVLAVVGYFGGAMLGIHIGPATQPTITSTSINATATYADVDVTVQKVQRAQSFLDDPNVGADGAIRLFLLEESKAPVPVNLPYDSMAHLILPDGQAVTPSYVGASIGLQPGASKTGRLDFAVSMDAKLDQLALRLGGADDAPVDIPLRAGADMNGYAPKVTQLGGAWEYLGLNWSLVSATTQLSMDGKQAAKNMQYMTVTLKVDNTLAQTAIAGSPYDYIRLKTGGATLVPAEATLPVSFQMGARGQSGTVTFLVPQNATAFTLIMVPQKQGGFDQASQDFHL